MTFNLVIVDDNEIDRYSARRAIQKSKLPCSIIEFDAGDHFVSEYLDESQPTKDTDQAGATVVLLDINMPRMNGLEVLRAYAERKLGPKKMRSCMIFLMFTSSAHAKDQSAALSYDFVKDFIIKPLDVQKIQKIVSRYLDQ